MNLASSSGTANKLSFVPFAAKIVKEEGVLSLYNGLQAGILRQSESLTRIHDSDPDTDS